MAEASPPCIHYVGFRDDCYFDDDENVARSGGVDWFAATRRALGI